MMSMIGNYCMITKEQFDALHNQEISISNFLYSEPSKREAKNFLDIDKAWDAIQFTLTGHGFIDVGNTERTPLFDIVVGGQSISEEDVGYGCARYLTNKEVKECYQAIKNITKTEWKSKFNMNEMLIEQVYPLYGAEDEEEFFEYTYNHFEALQHFFRTASDEDRYMLLYIN